LPENPAKIKISGQICLSINGMSKMKQIISIVIANVFLAILSSVSNASVFPEGRCYLMDVTSGPCKMVINEKKYEINIEGKITYSSAKGDTRSIQPILPDHFYVQAVQSYVFNEDIIFLLEITDDDAGSTLVVMCKPSSVGLLWTAELGTFNPSPPLVDEGSVYIAGIGTVAKIDIKTGRIVWKHTGLYEQDTMAFNAFSKPIKRGNVIVFQEEKDSFAKYHESGEVINK